MGFRQNIPCGSLDYDDCVKCRDKECQAACAAEIANECVGLPNANDPSNTDDTYTYQDCVINAQDGRSLCYAGARIMCLGGSVGGIISDTAKDVWRGIKEWF